MSHQHIHIGRLLHKLNQSIALEEEERVWLQGIIEERMGGVGADERAHWQKIASVVTETGQLAGLDDEHQYQLYYLLQQIVNSVDKSYN